MKLKPMHVQRGTDKMKISKRQLRRIIKEEKSRLLKETVSLHLLENLLSAMDAIVYELDDNEWAAEVILEEVNGFIEGITQELPERMPGANRRR